MKENKNIEYEKLVQEIYEALHNAEGLRVVKVLHDARIQGKSGCKHQIDVYWEIKIADELFKVAIECKNYARRVELGRIRDFFAVLHDLEDTKGIVVTTVGFSRGAIGFADHYGITLKEVRIPKPEDWTGRLKDIDLHINAIKPIILGRNVVPDNQWLVEKGKVKSQGEQIRFSVPQSWEDKIVIWDEFGNRITDFLQMKKELPCGWIEEQGLKHRYDFDSGYMDTVESGRIKISRIEFVYDVVSASVSTIVDGGEIAKAIIRDVRNGEIKLIDRHGNVR